MKLSQETLNLIIFVLIVLLLSLFVVIKSVQAEEYIQLPNGNIEVSADQFGKDMQDIAKLDDLVKLREVMQNDIKVLEKSIVKYKENEVLNEQIIKDLERILFHKEKYQEYADKLIDAQIKEIERGGSWFDKFRSQAFLPLLLTVMILLAPIGL